jgi:hypothetical protein
LTDLKSLFGVVAVIFSKDLLVINGGSIPHHQLNGAVILSHPANIIVGSLVLNIIQKKKFPKCFILVQVHS